MACQGGFSASPVRLTFHEKISRGRSIFCCPFAQSAPRWFRNRKIRISKTLTARKRLFSSWCPGGINISQPKLFSCWGSITALSQKNKNALPGQAPPEKASELSGAPSILPSGGPGDCCGYPGSIWYYLQGSSWSPYR